MHVFSIEFEIDNRVSHCFTFWFSCWFFFSYKFWQIDIEIRQRRLQLKKKKIEDENGKNLGTRNYYIDLSSPLAYFVIFYKLRFFLVFLNCKIHGKRSFKNKYISLILSCS
jgi:hypothetical protein